ncbi:hypothetical protein N1851_014330 [Merluccius polli]|uniref:Uncharacterized protein n=1 Tax=Merluccius polli TaxID=89951 RepID=A0AA47MTJ5_MERPO|nr:hypothetical protein N1851_014330 [Merluccius polli]
MTQTETQSYILMLLPSQSQRFKRFSWKSLVQALAFLRYIIQSHKIVETGMTGWHVCTEPQTVEELAEVEMLIITCVQRETYNKEFSCLAAKKRLEHVAPLNTKEKYPFIIPGRNHITNLLVRHFHNKVRHQRRVFTEGAIRKAGCWILNSGSKDVH